MYTKEDSLFYKCTNGDSEVTPIAFKADTIDTD